MDAYLREDLATLRYKPVKPLDVLSEEIGLPESELVKLDANENLWPLPASVRGAMAEACMHIYPDPLQLLLREQLAALHGVKVEQVVAGAGSDDLLDVIIRMVETPSIVIAPPTFGMYSFLAKIAKVGVVNTSRKDFVLDIDATIEHIRQSGSRLAIFASPNNPTGNVIPNADIERLCGEKCIIVIDEAYAEFADNSSESLLAKHPNLIVLRTFSKWAGLAGLRVGYAIGDAVLIDKMIAIKQPYNINAAADVAARAALAVRPQIMQIVKAIVVERDRLFAELSKFSFLEPTPSQANFILCKVSEISAAGLANGLRTKGVLVRYFGQQGGDLSSYIRISASRPQDTDRVLEELRLVAAALQQGADLRKLVEERQIDTLLFDMDGVLADVARSYRATILLTAEKYGISITAADVTAAKALGNANDDWILSHRLIGDRWAKEGPVLPTLQEVTDAFEDIYQGKDGVAGLEATESLLPSRVLLEALAEKFTCAVVTGRPRKDAERFLQRNGIAKYFQHVVCMGDAPSKPDPAPVRLALEKVGKERALLIGDTVDDIRAATAAGALAVGVPPPGENEQETAKTLAGAGAAVVLTPKLLQLAALL